METKIKNFLQSDMFILSISLLLGFICHFFVATEIVASDQRLKDKKSLYTSVFKFDPLKGRKLQSNDQKADIKKEPLDFLKP